MIGLWIFSVHVRFYVLITICRLKAHCMRIRLIMFTNCSYHRLSSVTSSSVLVILELEVGYFKSGIGRGQKMACWWTPQHVHT